ncbi:SPOR domain-containing protein [Sphingomonas jatrophae]|uniref:Flp pilus assembly protein TadD, contains TPR repeats n=1 Tax=Sphingomonas jatrophae TaxID=1166337 RepID=A0A1I6M6Q3_9SPHN|nr:SPOR domain-containing protein [Sphingomonas jatrophae]SFS11303.1 Flp pilus assembly protein TadD, contains TPR repeats [Sphingomonas jatrophae]
MTRFARLALAAVLPLSAATIAAAQAPVPGYGIPGQDDPVERLGRYLRVLSTSPRDLEALTGAGRAALDVGDAAAAIGFFSRAEEIAPRDGRIKAGLGSALVQMEQAAQALKLFDQAVDLGVPVATIAADRGLAHDLRGENKRAQADYVAALRAAPSDETVRRLALSQAMSGDRTAAMATLDPLLRRQDKAAWRASTFVLALTGDPRGATERLGLLVPAGQAAQIAPFLAKLGSLRAGEQAQAVHFGHLPTANTRLAGALPNPTPTPSASTQALAPQAAPFASRYADAAPRTSRTPPPVTPPVARQAAPLPAPVQTRPLATLTPSRATTPLPGSVQTGATAAQPTPPQPAPTSTYAGSPSPAPALLPTPAAAAPVPTPTQSTSAVTRAPAPSRVGPLPASVQAFAAGLMPQAAPPPSTPAAVAAIPLPPSAATSASTSSGLPPSGTGAEPGFATLASAASPQTASLPSPTRTETRTADEAPPPRLARAATEPVKAATPRTRTVDAVAKPKPVRVAAADEADEPAKPTRKGRTQVAAADETDAPATTKTGRKGKAAATQLASAEPLDPPTGKATRKGKTTEPDEDKSTRTKLTAADKKKADKAAADKKKADAEKATKLAEAKASAAKAKKEPERHWVQVATGAYKGDLAKAWNKVKADHPQTMAGKSAWTTPLRFTNRVLVGPFKSADEAQAFVNANAKAGFTTSRFTSSAGQPVERLGGK